MRPSRLEIPPAPADHLYGSYFVAAYPPFARWQEEQIPAVHARLGTAPADAGSPFGLYVHVPVCEQRCDFCYYLSYADRGDRIDAYLDALVEELALYRQTARFADRPLQFAYFGGGTPSLLSTPRLERLFAGLEESFSFDPAVELTFECAPRSLTEEKRPSPTGPHWRRQRQLLGIRAVWRHGADWDIRAGWNWAWGDDADLVSVTSIVPGYVSLRHWGHWQAETHVSVGWRYGGVRLQAGLARRVPVLSAPLQTWWEGLVRIVRDW